MNGTYKRKKRKKEKKEKNWQTGVGRWMKKKMKRKSRGTLSACRTRRPVANPAAPRNFTKRHKRCFFFPICLNVIRCPRADNKTADRFHKSVVDGR